MDDLPGGLPFFLIYLLIAKITYPYRKYQHRKQLE